MSRMRKQKRVHQDSAPEQRARIYSGSYDGSHGSQDFVVSGHSTGSPYSEMEAMSIQNSIDVGAVPYYEVDGTSVFPDADSPELKSFTQEESNSSFGKVALWSSVGLAGAALGYLALRYYGTRSGLTESSSQ